MDTAKNAIVIFGGFLSFPVAYQEMREALHRLTGQSVFIVNARGVDWLMSVSVDGWVNLLNKLDRTVRKAVTTSATGKVTLVGHSAGGLLARLYLGSKPFRGKIYDGVEWIDRLITLGSPHLNRGGLQRGGWMSRWIEQRYPGTYYSPRVGYTSVAGKAWRGSLLTTRYARWLYSVYEDICGDGTTWGDGLIPIESALLPGSEQLVLDGVSHFSMIITPWYGSPEVIEQWWKRIDSNFGGMILTKPFEPRFGEL